MVTDPEPSSELSEQESSVPPAGPTTRQRRISSLDTLRGVAILGILPMNSLAFGLERAAYLNVSADGISQPVDWVVGLLTMLVIDQKMMALFSLLFGVGVVVFAERAAAKGRRVVWLSLWRFFLLFVIGLLHSLLWEGDILMVYAVCAPVVLLVRRLPSSVLVACGSLLALAGTFAAPAAQGTVGPDGVELGELWLVGQGSMSDEVLLWFYGNAVGRALGLMLIGVVLYRHGIVQGRRDEAVYRRMAIWGLGVGGSITAAGLVFRMIDEWSNGAAIVGHMPTGLGTIPLALGIMAVVIIWDGGTSPQLARFRNLGRMALTNYLTQTILGVVTLTWLLGDVDLSRTMIAAWILGVWAIQLWWSTWWLERFRFGPFEWAWRCATYRSRQPLRR